MTQLSRRGILTGLGAIICAPAIVRASSLMPVKALPLIAPTHLDGTWHQKTPDEILHDIHVCFEILIAQSCLVPPRYQPVPPRLAYMMDPMRKNLELFL